jgi:hypothetical protein
MGPWQLGRLCVLSLATPAAVLSLALAEEEQFGTPKGTEGTRIFNATEHPFYSGKFRLKGGAPLLIGSMSDQSPWDHLDYAGKRLSPVQGTIEIDVNELTNSGRVMAQFVEGTDHYRVVFDRFTAKQPFHNDGIATRVYEHGDSNNGDPLYPKTWLYLAGWGTATVFKMMTSSTRTMTPILW